MTMTDKSRARMEELVDHLSKTKELHPAMGYDVERAFSDGYISGLKDPDANAEILKEVEQFLLNIEPSVLPMRHRAWRHDLLSKFKARGEK